MEILLEYNNVFHALSIENPTKIEETINKYISNNLRLESFVLTMSPGQLNELESGDIVGIKILGCDDLDCLSRDPIKIIRKGHLNCLKTCVLGIDNKQYIHIAAKYNHLNIIKWLLNPNTGSGTCKWSFCTVSAASRNGRSEIVDCIRKSC